MIKELTLLYIEDDRDMQIYMKKLLLNEVKEFYQAYDGAEGLQIFNAKRPDIILSDINMPILNGLELCKKVRAIVHDQIIILLTSLDDIETLKELIDLNINSYINKPVLDIDIVFRKIEEQGALLRYKQLKIKEEKLKSILEVIQEVSHHWRQPLNVISMISSKYQYQYENNMLITKEDLKQCETITDLVLKLSNVLEQIENITVEEKNIDNLLELIRISNPMYKN